MRILDNGLDQRLLDPLSPEARELRAKGIFPVDVRLVFVVSERQRRFWGAPSESRQITFEDWCGMQTFPDDDFPHSRLFRDPRFPAREACNLIEVQIREAFRDGRGHLIERDNHTFGFVTWKGPWLEYIYVPPIHRGLHVGEHLVHAALENGVTCVATQATNVAAIRLYTKMGFELERALEWYHVEEKQT